MDAVKLNSLFEVRSAYSLSVYAFPSGLQYDAGHGVLMVQLDRELLQGSRRSKDEAGRGQSFGRSDGPASDIGCMRRRRNKASLTPEPRDKRCQKEVRILFVQESSTIKYFFCILTHEYEIVL